MKTWQIYTNADCNLRCKYCYEHRKGPQVNSAELAADFLSFALRQEAEARGADALHEVVLDFVGGEPFLHPGLLRTCVERVLTDCAALGAPRLPALSFSSNGTLFAREDALGEEVRDFVERYGRYLHVGLSIDGTRACHDLARVDASGKGSWDSAVTGYLWLKQHVPACQLSVKATFSHATMNFYAESLLALMSLGFTEIAANTVYEEVWTPEDGARFFDQMRFVADYLLEHGLEDKVHIQQINPLGSNWHDLPLLTARGQTHCGSCEHMRCLGMDGKVYGCHRFATAGIRPLGTFTKEDGLRLAPESLPLIAEVKRQWQEYPEDCKSCGFSQICSSCAALPYEEGLSAGEFFAQKRQCGFALACGWAASYLAWRLQEREKAEKPEATAEQEATA